MENFELRSRCNGLVAELSNHFGEKNIVKISIDIQLPDQYSGDAEKLFDPVRKFALYLSEVLVNGLITIELFENNKHDSMTVLAVLVCGKGLIRPNDKSRKQLDHFLNDSHLSVKEKNKNEELCFEFTHQLKEAVSSTLDPKLPFSGKKILVVEDNEINAMVFSSFLEDWGCENTVAVNGAEAVLLTHETSFDAILMDIHMPVLNGNLAIAKIREYSDVPIIALTASTEESDTDGAMKAGANDFLLKPVSSPQLFKVLSKFL